METLIASANSIAPLRNTKKVHRRDVKIRDQHPHEVATTSDNTLLSISRQSRIPRTLLASSSTNPKKPNSHIRDGKLRKHMTMITRHAQDTAALREEADLLLTEDSGKMIPEGDLEKTWKVSQEDIGRAVGQEQANARREWKLDGGPYRSRYTRNGRHIAIAGQKGHVATFNWQTGVLHNELQLNETIRDITFLNDHSHIAVAQKQYVYIYDQDGVEIHRLSSHIETNRLEYLPYHWLLASIGNAGFLKYLDTSTGQMVSEQRTRLGACRAMCQNLHNAVIYLGHQNGTVTLRTPNLSTPPINILAHLGGVTSLSVDPYSEGRYMATAGLDSKVKVWDCRNWRGCVREWSPRGSGGGIEVEWSAKGFLAVSSSGSVNLFSQPTVANTHQGVPPLYLKHSIPTRPLTSIRFCPFSDLLTIGHSSGLSTILVPGSGEPNFDSTEADPFENKKARREREVHRLLDKIQPELISLDANFIGQFTQNPLNFTEDQAKQSLAFSRLPRLDRLKITGRADDLDEPQVDTASGQDMEDLNSSSEPDKGKMPEKPQPQKEKKKMRGRGKSLSRHLRKKRKNIIDPSTIAIRKKIEAQKEQRKSERHEKGSETIAKPSALDRFRA